MGAKQPSTPQLTYYSLSVLPSTGPRQFTPTQSLIFIGVVIDTVKCELCLPADRVTDLLSLLQATVSKCKCSKLHLQCPTGKLNWAARVVRGGRTFLRCLITVANSFKRQYHHVYLNLQARADLQWWTSLLPAHNYKILFPAEIPQLSSPVFNDASLTGGGCVWQTDWFYRHCFSLKNTTISTY